MKKKMDLQRSQTFQRKMQCHKLAKEPSTCCAKFVVQMVEWSTSTPPPQSIFGCDHGDKNGFFTERTRNTTSMNFNNFCKLSSHPLSYRLVQSALLFIWSITSKVFTLRLSKAIDNILRILQKFPFLFGGPTEKIIL